MVAWDEDWDEEEEEWDEDEWEDNEEESEDEEEEEEWDEEEEEEWEQDIDEELPAGAAADIGVNMISEGALGLEMMESEEVQLESVERFEDP